MTEIFEGVIVRIVLHEGKKMFLLPKDKQFDMWNTTIDTPEGLLSQGFYMGQLDSWEATPDGDYVKVDTSCLLLRGGALFDESRLSFVFRQTGGYYTFVGFGKIQSQTPEGYNEMRPEWFEANDTIIFVKKTYVQPGVVNL